MADSAIREQQVVVDGVRVYSRLRDGDGEPVVFVHGNPTHSEHWLPFVERLAGPFVALDLPGWGRSERPSDFDYSMHGLARFVERFLEVLEIDAYRLCCDDWGALALIAAQRHPRRLRRLVVIDAVPLLPGYRWHWVARWIWRPPVVGELLTALSTRTAFALGLRQATGDRGPMPPAFVDMIWNHLDAGTRRAILQLYRSAPETELARAGADLGRLECPALVVWGERDAYLPLRFGRMYAERLPGAELHLVEGGGHWPWLDDPSVIDRVTAFLEGADHRGGTHASVPRR